MNDNSPVFVYPESSKKFNKTKYFGGVAAERRDVGAYVLDVKVKYNSFFISSKIQ